DPAAVGSRERSVARHLTAHRLPTREREGWDGAGPTGEDVGHGHVDRLSVTGPRPTHQRRADGHRGIDAPGEVGDGRPGDHRPLPGTRLQYRRPRLAADVVAGHGRERARLPIPRDRAVDDGCVDATDAVVVDAEGADDAGTEPLDDDIRVP